MKQETKRLYNIADADLKQLADDLKNSITRDAADFATRKVDAAQLTAFEALAEAFGAFPTDIELKGLITDAAEIKDKEVEALQIAIRTVRGIAEDTFGSSGKYKVFGFDDMTHLSDSKMVQMANRVVRVGTTTQAALADKGLTPAHLTSITALATAVDKAINAVHAAEENRDISTQDRIESGNKLYTELTRLARIGKNLFADTDEARYNDYVVIGSKAEEKNDEDNPPA